MAAAPALPYGAGSLCGSYGSVPAGPAMAGPPFQGAMTGPAPMIAGGFQGSPQYLPPVVGPPYAGAPYCGPCAGAPYAGAPCAGPPCVGGAIMPAGAPLMAGPPGAPMSGPVRAASYGVPMSGPASYGAPMASYGAPMAGPPLMGPPVGPPMAGPLMAGPPMAGPPMAGPPMSGPPMAGPPMAGPPMAGPPIVGPPAAVVGPPAVIGPPMAGPPVRTASYGGLQQPMYGGLQQPMYGGLQQPMCHPGYTAPLAGGVVTSRSSSPMRAAQYLPSSRAASVSVSAAPVVASVPAMPAGGTAMRMEPIAASAGTQILNTYSAAPSQILSSTSGYFGGNVVSANSYGAPLVSANNYGAPLVSVPSIPAYGAPVVSSGVVASSPVGGVQGFGQPELAPDFGDGLEESTTLNM